MVDRRTVEDGSFLADGLVGNTPSVVYGTGRVCIEANCTVRLSRYNSTEWCALHESPASTQRPYDTSTRQPRGRRRNSRRRVSVPQGSADNLVMAQSTVAQSAPTKSAPAEQTKAGGKSAAKSNRKNAA